MSPADLWNAAVPESDRSLWTAQLFPEFHLDSAGSCSVRAQCGKLLSAAPRLALTWLQDLPNLEPTFDCSDSTSESDNCGKCSESNNGLPVAYVEAVGCWRQAKRVSLADILSTGNATGMLHWRTWLQVAHDSDYHGSSRVERLLGVDKLNSDLFAGFFHVAAFLRSCEMQGGFMVSPCAVLLALWLSNLCSPAQSAAQQGMCLLQVLRKVRPCADSDNIGSIKAFIALESKILSQGNPSIPHVLTAFLRSFVTEKVELLAVLQSLLVGVQFYPIYMHSRAVFLAAWLLKGRTLFVRTSDKQDILTQGDFGSANDHDKRPIDLQQQGVAVCLKVLQLVISTLARGKIAPDDSSDSELSAALEDIAQSFVALHMRYSLDCYSSAQTSAAFCGTIPSAPAPTSTPALEPVSGALSSSTNQGHKYAALRDCVVLSRAPVRVDLAGGWSDTPPICYEMSGAVRI